MKKFLFLIALSFNSHAEYFYTRISYGLGNMTTKQNYMQSAERESFNSSSYTALSAGKKINENFSIEISLYKFSKTKFLSSNIQISYSAINPMMNFIYETQNNTILKPYFITGIGHANIHFQKNNLLLNEQYHKKHNSLTYLLGLGIKIDLYKNLQINLGAHHHVMSKGTSYNNINYGALKFNVIEVSFLLKI